MGETVRDVDREEAAVGMSMDARAAQNLKSMAVMAAVWPPNQGTLGLGLLQTHWRKADENFDSAT